MRSLLILQDDDGCVTIKLDGCQSMADLQGLIEYGRTYAHILAVDSIQAGRAANAKLFVNENGTAKSVSEIVEELGLCSEEPRSMPTAEDRASKVFNKNTKEASNGEGPS